MVLRKLAISNFLTRKVRVALTVAAIALSVSLVVAVTSGYASAEGAAHFYLNRYLGSADAQITRQGNTPLDMAVVADLERDPDVEVVTARLETEAALRNKDGAAIEGRGAQVIGIRRPADRQVEQLPMLFGGWFDADEGDVAVIDQIASERLGVKVGETFEIPGAGAPLKLRVVGVVHKPGILAAQMQTVYVPLRTLQRFAMSGQKPSATRVMVEFKSDRNADAFAERWRAKLKAMDPLIRLRLTRESRRELDKSLQGVRVLSYLGGTVSMLAATFIVFSALSMGVAERQRTLAMLRAIGMHKVQLGRMVVGEGIILACCGILIGVPLGLLWVVVLTSLPQFKEILPAGLVVSWGGIVLGALGSLAAALAASVLPAWNAMRVSPLEAMSPLAEPPASRIPWKLTVAGALLACIDSFLIFGPVDGIVPSAEIARAVRFYGHFALGLPGIMIGFFLLAPLFVFVVERVVGPVVSAMFGLRFALLRQQLSGGVWRAAGTCAALMVGLAILVVMNVQGNSALAGWKLPDKFPDVFITAPVLNPLDDASLQKLRAVPGVRQAMPIAIASPEFSNPIFAMIGAAVIPNATMFFGVDPEIAFDLMELDFRQGTARQAQEMLRKGRHVIVTEEFRQIKGLGVGDKLKLRTPKHGDVDYTIAGVVWSPGIDVIVSMQDMGRQFDERTAASIFGSLADAREDFGVDRHFLVAANLDYGVEKQELIKRIEQALERRNMKIGDIRAIKFAIQSGFHRLLLFISTVAIAAMAVASLGVTNTIMASIRSRRWHFGVLRSVGVTRSQLLRLVMAEAALLGLVGVALGLAAGAVMSVNANGLSRIFIGYAPDIVVPWGIVLGGAGAIMLIALLASLWPAWGVARTSPLTLLQAGRASS